MDYLIALALGFLLYHTSSETDMNKQTAHRWIAASVLVFLVVVALIWSVPAAHAQDSNATPPDKPAAETEPAAPDDGWKPLTWDDAAPYPGTNGAPATYTHRMAVSMTGFLPPPPYRPPVSASLIGEPMVVVPNTSPVGSQPVVAVLAVDREGRWWLVVLSLRVAVESSKAPNPFREMQSYDPQVSPPKGLPRYDGSGGVQIDMGVVDPK